MKTIGRSRWFVPLFALVMGALTAIIIGFLIEVAHGHEGNPYTWLGMVAGLAYIAAVVAMRIRG